MFEVNFKTIDETLRNDGGPSGDVDYIEQTSWLLFLKWLDDYENEKEDESSFDNITYERIIKKEYSWSTWASPKNKDGSINYNKTKTGEDLKDFIDNELFPYLSSFINDTDGADTIKYKIGQIYNELKNKIQSGYNIRKIVDEIDNLQFRSHTEKNELSILYEEKIKIMGNAGRNGGEYYTPRALIRTIIAIINPRIGETVYDGAVGSGGFLVEAFNYIKNSKELTTREFKKLRNKTLYGKEKKPVPFIIGIMNMILHGIEAPNIIHTNTLEENILEIQDKDRHDCVIVNPPFGGNEDVQIQQNFPIRTSETAFLFLQHFIKILKNKGRCGLVIKKTFLNNDDNSSVSLRKLLLEECNLQTILELPKKTFLASSIPTVVLFFNKGTPTKKIWYYQLNLNRNLGKKHPINMKDLEDFRKLEKNKSISNNSWLVDIKDINEKSYDLTPVNPNIKKEPPLKQPMAYIEEIKELNTQSNNIINKIKSLI